MFWTKKKGANLSQAAELMNNLVDALEAAREISTNLESTRETQRLVRHLDKAQEACSALSDELKEAAEEFHNALTSYRDTSKARYQDAKKVLDEIVESLNRLK